MLICEGMDDAVMSADDEEGVALKGLERGAAFFILKPVCPDDVRDLWQFASLRNQQDQEEENISSESATSTVVVNKRKSPQKQAASAASQDNSQSKKPKVIWTNSLHNSFLEAIRSIGLDSKLLSFYCVDDGHSSCTN